MTTIISLTKALGGPWLIAKHIKNQIIIEKIITHFVSQVSTQTISMSYKSNRKKIYKIDFKFYRIFLNK